MGVSSGSYWRKLSEMQNLHILLTVCTFIVSVITDLNNASTLLLWGNFKCATKSISCIVVAKVYLWHMPLQVLLIVSSGWCRQSLNVLSLLASWPEFRISNCWYHSFPIHLWFAIFRIAFFDHFFLNQSRNVLHHAVLVFLFIVFVSFRPVRSWKLRLQLGTCTWEDSMWHMVTGAITKWWSHLEESARGGMM